MTANKQSIEFKEKIKNLIIQIWLNAGNDTAINQSQGFVYLEYVLLFREYHSPACALSYLSSLHLSKMCIIHRSLKGSKTQTFALSYFLCCKLQGLR